MNATTIYEEQVSSWGEHRALYSVTPEEIKILRNEGGEPLITNQDNRDGTFYNEISFRDKKFACSSIQKI